MPGSAASENTWREPGKELVKTTCIYQGSLISTSIFYNLHEVIPV